MSLFKYRTRHLLLSFVLVATCAKSEILYSEDHDIEGFGEVDELIFSATFTVPEQSSLDGVSVAMTHNYAAELELSLTSPSAEVFYLLQGNGLRTRVGDGSGTLGGIETYILIESGSPLGGVADWRPAYVPGGTYDALQWPSGLLPSGSWTIALRNVNKSGLEGGALGNVTVYGRPIPEPRTSILGLIAVGGLLSWRRSRMACRTKRWSERATRLPVNITRQSDTSTVEQHRQLRRVAHLNRSTALSFLHARA